MRAPCSPLTPLQTGRLLVRLRYSQPPPSHPKRACKDGEDMREEQHERGRREGHEESEEGGWRGELEGSREGVDWRDEESGRDLPLFRVTPTPPQQKAVVPILRLSTPPSWSNPAHTPSPPLPATQRTKWFSRVLRIHRAGCALSLLAAAGADHPLALLPQPSTCALLNAR